MKFALLLVALACPLRAELLATFQTTQGNVEVILHYDKAPQAVANFITLAQGTRTHVDPTTGAVTNTPYYTGEKFFRVVNDAGFKIAQTGSGTGNTLGDPGFTFKDEFHATLTHVPYVLSMANSGPNTNGSQIFLTGNTSIPSLNLVHTVFGIVIDPPSRTTIDAILAAGSDGTTINSVAFSRTDPAAAAFNEQEQNLPTVTGSKGILAVTRNVSAIWNLNETQATGDIFRAFRSATLASGSWAELTSAKRQNGIVPVGNTSVILPVQLDDAAAPQAFYHLSYARHPGSVTPDTLAGRLVAMALGPQLFQYLFDGTGNGGLARFYPNPNEYVEFTFSLVDFDATAHSFNFIVDNQTAAIPEIMRFQFGCDSANNTHVFGRHTTFIYDDGFQLAGRGNASVTR